GHLTDPAMQKPGTVEMNNDRVARRPTLRLKNLPHRRRVLSVRAQSVNSLCGESHELAVAQRLHGGLDLDLSSSDDTDHSANDSTKPRGASDRRVVGKRLIRDDCLSQL